MNVSILMLACAVALLGAVSTVVLAVINRVQSKRDFRQKVNMQATLQNQNYAIADLIKKLEGCESVGDMRRAIDEVKGQPPSNRAQRRGKIVVPGKN